jgi:hypothetical protein
MPARHSAQELDMLDPKEQAKGGFRAHLAREAERHENREIASQADGTSPETADDATQQGDGSDAAAPQAIAEPATPTGRQPKRWH